MGDTRTIRPLALPFDATLALPGSKSECNRVLIAAALSPGETVLKNMNPCDDVKHMTEGLTTLGCDCKWENETTVKVSDFTLQENPKSEIRNPKEIFCGNSGTTVRFLTALACLIPGEWIITGDEHMQQRPIQPLIDALKELGAEIEAEGGCPPVRVIGGTITKNACTLDASKSSQYLTALLLIGATIDDGLTIKLKGELTSPTYVDMTIGLLEKFGVTLSSSKGDMLKIEGRQEFSEMPSYEIEGDWSAAGSFLVLAELTNSRIQFSNISFETKQGDAGVPQVIKSMRADGDLTIDCTAFPDQLMNLAVLAAHRKGKTTFIGAANLRIKECDRIAVITQELTKAGIHIEEHEDGVIVHESCNLQPAACNPHNDHRMAMAFAVLGSVYDGITVEQPDCVSKTYLHFFDDLEKLHRTPRCVAIVGMRACGKSQLAAKLAKKLTLTVRDTDQMFEKEEGMSINTYVENHDWASFRKREEKVVQQALEPGHVVSLGGGAIESAATRAALKREAVVIWMQSQPNVIIKRLKELNRPALSGKPLEEEVQEVMARREPLYREVANVILPAATPISKYVPVLQDSLKALCTW